MAAVDTAPNTLSPSSQVPLDTIPVSPAKENADPTMSSGDDSQPANGDEAVTVFHDHDNFNVKHPLMNEWTLWFTKPPSGKVGHTSWGRVQGLPS